jgi:hypothetical protein
MVAGCASQADTASKNIGKQCEKFECQRAIVVYNGITDKVILQVEGRCSLEHVTLGLELTCKYGPNDYRKNFVGLSDNTTWTSTQLNKLAVSEYRTKWIIKPSVPDLDLVTGGNN